MLEIARGADDEDIETVAISADISLRHLIQRPMPPNRPGFHFSGNTGSFQTRWPIRYVAQCMKWKTARHRQQTTTVQVLGRRDNPAARKFVSALLSSVGIGGDDGEIRFDQKRDSRRGGLHLITRYFRAARDLSATVAGEEIPLQRGERIGMNFQYTYTPEAFRLLRARRPEILTEYGSADSTSTALCK
jgi:hypothetical protein